MRDSRKARTERAGAEARKTQAPRGNRRKNFSPAHKGRAVKDARGGLSRAKRESPGSPERFYGPTRTVG